MSLKKRISLSFVSSILIIFIPLLFFLQTKVKQNNQISMESQINDLVESKANEISAWLDRKLVEIKVLTDLDIANKLSQKELQDYIETLNKSEDFKDRFAIGGLDGIGFVGKDWYIDISQREYFKKLLSEDVDYVISHPVISKSDSRPVFLISHIIKDENNNKIGFINGAVELENIAGIVNNMEILDGFSWIMNTSKDTYSVDKDFLLENYLDEDSLDKIIANRNENITNIEIKDKKGNPSKLFFEEIPSNPDWILCSLVKESSINGQINNIISLILGLGISFIIISIIISLAISSSVVRPIKNLESKMIEVSKGDLTASYEVKGKDEISVLGSYFNKMVGEIKTLIDSNNLMAQQKRNLELKVLQAQIKPHFLYNTLDTIQWKALSKKNYEVADLINNLSEFFRLSLSDDREFISLEEEANQAISYLKIQEARYGNLFSYSTEIDESIIEEKIPKLILQPLLENSIYHGIKAKGKDGILKICAKDLGNQILIEVTDNGKGMDEQKLGEIKSNLEKAISADNYGLYNVYERLKIYYKDDFDLNIQSQIDKGCKISLRLKKENLC